MDWQRFFDENNIHYVTRGPNTKRGELSIACPYCGDDPSEHLGINLKSEFWGCLRNQSHRGRSARYLVKALLRCSTQQAFNVVRQYSHADPDSLEAIIREFDGEEPNAFNPMEKQASPSVQYGDFYPIKNRGSTRRFWQYLSVRCSAPTASRRYGLRCALTGRYKDRIIIPVIMNGEMVGWTARAITKTETAPRYLASNEEIKTCVWNYDALKDGGERLFIVEGPFDAIKLDSYFAQYSGIDGQKVFATCTFGTSVTVPQIAALRGLTKRFNQVYVLFDLGAESQGDHLAQWLGAKQAYLPSGTDDPGEMIKHQIDQLMDVTFNGWVNGKITYRNSAWFGSFAAANQKYGGR